MDQRKLIKVLAKHPELFNPLGNYVIIKLFDVEKESEGGIALPDQIVDHERHCLARVVKAGPGQRALFDAKPIGMFVKDGDLIVILKHAPVELKFYRESVYVIAEGDIVATIDEVGLQTLVDEFVEAAPAPVKEVVDPVVQTEGGIWVPRSDN